MIDDTHVTENNLHVFADSREEIEQYMAENYDGKGYELLFIPAPHDYQKPWLVKVPTTGLPDEGSRIKGGE
jgi:hypothetical protein